MGDTAINECEDEIPYNGIDEDCDGRDLTDVDGDGWDAAVVGGEDCDDEDAAVNPGAEEVCGDLVDDDCDGRTDEDCALGSAGPPDPGGFYWVCGLEGGPAGGATGLAVALLVALAARRRPSRWR